MAGIIEVKDQGKLRIYDADNSHYIDIVVPSSVTANRTITIPDASFTVPQADTDTVFSSSTITGQSAETSVANDDLVVISDTSASGALKKMTKANFVGSTGKILQVVNGLTTTAVTHVSDGGQVDTGLTATITPTASSSTIMVFISQSNKVERGAVQLSYTLRLFRDSSEVEQWPEVCAEDVENADRFYGSNHCFNFLDSPSTTSQIVYKTTGAIASSGGGRTVRFQDSSAPSTMTLMELLIFQ